MDDNFLRLHLNRIHGPNPRRLVAGFQSFHDALRFCDLLHIVPYLHFASLAKCHKPIFQPTRKKDLRIQALVVLFHAGQQLAAISIDSCLSDGCFTYLLALQFAIYREC